MHAKNVSSLVGGGLLRRVRSIQSSGSSSPRPRGSAFRASALSLGRSPGGGLRVSCRRLSGQQAGWFHLALSPISSGCYGRRSFLVGDVL